MRNVIVHQPGGPRAYSAPAGNRVGDLLLIIAEAFTTDAGGVDVTELVLSVRDGRELRHEEIVMEVVDEGAHLHARHRHRHCHEVAVHVRHGVTKTQAFPISTSVRTVREWAESKFEIVPTQRGQYRLQRPGATTFLDEDDVLGDVVASSPCSLSVDLVRLEQNAG